MPSFALPQLERLYIAAQRFVDEAAPATTMSSPHIVPGVISHNISRLMTKHNITLLDARQQLSSSKASPINAHLPLPFPGHVASARWLYSSIKVIILPASFMMKQDVHAKSFSRAFCYRSQPGESPPYPSAEAPASATATTSIPLVISTAPIVDNRQLDMRR